MQTASNASVVAFCVRCTSKKYLASGLSTFYAIYRIKHLYCLPIYFGISYCGNCVLVLSDTQKFLCHPRVIYIWFSLWENEAVWAFRQDRMRLFGAGFWQDRMRLFGAGFWQDRMRLFGAGFWQDRMRLFGVCVMWPSSKAVSLLSSSM